MGGLPGLGGPGVDLPGMTAAQREQARAIRERHRDEIARLIDQVRTAQQGLRASIETGQVDEGRATELGNAAGALALAQARMQAEVFALLTQDQRAALSTRRDEMRRWLDSRPGGPGGRGGRRGRP